MTDQTTQPATTLDRYAKAIAKVVEAGGPRPVYEMFENGVGVFLASPLGGIIDELVIIAVLEKYVREDVVMWYRTPRPRVECIAPEYRTHTRCWRWRVLTQGSDRVECPTESHIAFLEAIAEAVAGEKGGSDG